MIEKILGLGTVALLCASVTFGDSHAVSLETGDILVADRHAFGGGMGPGGIIKVDPVTGDQTVISSAGLFANPNDLVLDTDGTILVADFSAIDGKGAIIRVDPSDGSQTVVSTGGLFTSPYKLTLDAEGMIIVTDPGVGDVPKILKVDPQTGAQSIISQGLPNINSGGFGIAESGTIYFADRHFSGVIAVDPLTGNQTVVSQGGLFTDPGEIVIDHDGSLLVADDNAFNVWPALPSGAVFRVDPVTGAQSVVSQGGQFANPFGIDMEPDGQILVAQHGSPANPGGVLGTIMRIDPDTGAQFVLSAGGYFNDPSAVYVVRAPAYECVGFEAPLDAAPITVRKNRALPLKARLFDQDGFPISDLDVEAFPVVQIIFESGLPTEEPIDVTEFAMPPGKATDGNEFSYEQLDQLWRYILSTKSFSAEGSYSMSLVSGDSAEYVVDPKCEAVFVIE